MHTDDYLRPLPDQIASQLQGFGQNILARGRLKHELDDNHIARALEQDLKEGGPLGMLSLITALIGSGSFTRELLLRQAGGICTAAQLVLFEELLDDFEGSDALRDCWTVMSNRNYRLNFEHY